MRNTIGVDISKDTLDAYALASQTHRQFTNDGCGHRALRTWALDQCAELIVFEPTGRYHRAFERGLAAIGLAYAAVNPLQARRFAEAMAGRPAKTDRADAAFLARMGAALEVQADVPRPENILLLSELLSARHALVQDRSAAEARREEATLALIRCQLDARLRQIKGHLDKIDAEIEGKIAADTALARRREILLSIPGIGPVSAALLVIAMPELGSVDAKAAASLAGLAPITRQSGRWRGQSRIGGGRSLVRNGLYMPTLTAVRYNADLKDFYARLIDCGKPQKVAITAAMRKLLILANALLKKDKMWEPGHA